MRVGEPRFIGSARIYYSGGKVQGFGGRQADLDPAFLEWGFTICPQRHNLSCWKVKAIALSYFSASSTCPPFLLPLVPVVLILFPASPGKPFSCVSTCSNPAHSFPPHRGKKPPPQPLELLVLWDAIRNLLPCNAHHLVTRLIAPLDHRLPGAQAIYSCLSAPHRSRCCLQD